MILCADAMYDRPPVHRMLPLLRYLSIPELLAPHDTRCGLGAARKCLCIRSFEAGSSVVVSPLRMARRFKDPRLRALFTFQDLYVGLSPYTAPGVFSLLAATELTDGVWYPCGGFGKVKGERPLHQAWRFL